jgi:hypothetical protein
MNLCGQNGESTSVEDSWAAGLIQICVPAPCPSPYLSLPRAQKMESSPRKMLLLKE